MKLPRLLGFALLLGATTMLQPAFAQPSFPKLQKPDGLPEIPDAAKEKALELTAGLRDELLCSLASYPDDVLSAMFVAAQHPDYLVKMEAHPSDTQFNSAASYLYNKYPDALEVLRSNPLTTALIGAHAKENPEATWLAIDNCRREQSLVPANANSTPIDPNQAAALGQAISSMATNSQGAGNAGNALGSSGSLPTANANVNVEGLDELSSSIDNYADSVNSLSESLDDTNEELGAFNKNVDETQEEAEEVKEEYQSWKSEAQEAKEKYTGRESEVEERISKFESVTGGDSSSDSGGASEIFSALGFGRTGQATGSPMAWNSSSLPTAQLTQQMNKANLGAMGSFKRSEKQFGAGGGGLGGMPGGIGGSRSGGGRPGGPSGGGPGFGRR